MEKEKGTQAPTEKGEGERRRRIKGTRAKGEREKTSGGVEGG